MSGIRSLFRTPVAKSAAEVFKSLVSDAGITADSYDAAFIEELSNNLGVPRGMSIPEHLQRADVSVESFISEFFRTSQPLVLMVQDILKTFEKAGARYGDKNLRIQFNFSESSVKEVKLEHFREWVETWEKILVVIPARRWSFDALWSFCRVLSNSNVVGNREPLKKWVEIYDGGLWPDWIPNAPETKHRELDIQIHNIWRVMRSLITASRRYGPNRSDLRKYDSHDDVGDTRERFYLDRREDEFSERRALNSIDSESWYLRIMELCYGILEYATGIKEAVRDEKFRIWAGEFESIFSRAGVTRSTEEDAVRSLKDFLNLPMWKQRHEVYSVWVGCELAASLDSGGMTLHPVDGMLSFSFRGVHLGTTQGTEQPLFLWCEVCSPLDKPRGKGRKKAVKPDYRVMPAPMSSPERSALVVECKQYLRSSSKNFVDAVIDYANACPQASIVLVNYGPIGKDVRESIDSLVDVSVGRRIHLIPDMKPDQIKQREIFRNYVIAATRCEESLSLAALRLRGRHTSGRTISAILRWNAQPQDLDLHLVVNVLGRKPEDISFPQKKCPVYIESCSIIYHDDVTTGFGPERIDICNPVAGTYILYVHQYSGDGRLSGSGASISILCDGDSRGAWRCPSAQNGRNWVALAIIVTDSQMSIVDVSHITDNTPINSVMLLGV